ncbi:MAG: LptA/OstA family protein [Puniceicoccales bacterium]|jgi:lipopolysaccharide export system protein LptA|nr:LptA/OstA family protein [Puniceicoccales bacterium]
MFQGNWLIADNVFSEISSNRLEILPVDGHMEFRFSGNVSIKNTEFQAGADRMVVIAKSPKDQKTMTGSPSFDAIENIMAEGNVTLCQGERSGSADRIEIVTSVNEIFLSGNAKVSDSSGTIYGNMKINYRTKVVEIVGPGVSQAMVQVNAAENPANVPKEIAKSDVKQDVADDIDS